MTPLFSQNGVAFRRLNNTNDISLVDDVMSSKLGRIGMV